MSKKLLIGVAATVLVASVGGIAVAKNFRHGHHGVSQCSHGFGPGSHANRGGHGKRGHAMNVLKNADANKDGNISKDELMTAQDAKFKEFDLNSDGVVTADEVQKKLSSHYEKMAKRITRRFDANRDGKVSADEFKSNVEKKLYMMDLNDDGVISKDELPKRRMGMRKGHKRGHHRGSHHFSGQHRGSHHGPEGHHRVKPAEDQSKSDPQKEAPKSE